MHVVLLALAGQLWLSPIEEAPPAPRPAEVILYLVPSRPNGLDSRSLADAVSLYARDLQLSVQMIPDDVAAPTPDVVQRLAASLRARRARLAFWCLAGDDARTVGLYSVDARGVVGRDVINVIGLRSPDIHRAVALKLRAILTSAGTRGAPSPEAPSGAGAQDRNSDGDGGGARAAATAEPASGTSAGIPARSGARTSTREAPAAAATTAGGPDVAPAIAAPPEAPSAFNLAGAVDYCVVWVPGATSPRQAVALQAIVEIGSARRFEALAAVEAALPVTRTMDAGTASLLDVPLRLGGRLLFRRTGLVTGLGVFGALHLLAASATASSGGAQADSFTAAGGGGLEALARGPTPRALALPLSWEIRAWAEGLVPRTWFLVGGRPAVETGRYAIGVGLGLAFPAR